MGRVARRITSHAAERGERDAGQGDEHEAGASTSRTSSVSDTLRAICTAPPLRSDAVSMR